MDKSERKNRFDRKQAHKEKDRKNASRKHLEQLDRDDYFADYEEINDITEQEISGHWSKRVPDETN